MRDAYWQTADAATVRAFAAREKMDEAHALAALERMREKKILSQSAVDGDPYRFGYEPGIWYVTKALMRGVRPNKREEATVKRKTGMAWDDWAKRVREANGFAHPVGEVLIMGANRSGKTDFAAKLAIETAMRGSMSINAGFQSLPTGKQVQEPRVWHYLPKELKKTVKEQDEYIAYTKQNGFSGSKITFKNGSGIRFVTYEMDVNAVMEGSALDFCWMDEEFPKTFLDAARFRLASRRGSLLCTFTPVSGYTPVVADFLEGMVVTREHTAYMLPLDGKEPMPWMELGLARDEYETLTKWRDAGGTEDPGVPEARPEETWSWCYRSAGEKPAEDGRAFAKTPRLAVCKNGEAAAVWFYGRDNPYGMPGEVIAASMKNLNANREIKRRVYGIAEQIKGRLFPEWRREKNVVRDRDIPRELARCMVVDPAPERNWTAGWYGYDPIFDVLYKYREWPGDYEIPDVGVPGPWAVHSDKRNGLNDGAKGDAQESFGMGFLAYKYEWARLEGWEDFEKWRRAGHDEMHWPEDWDEVAEWSELNGARERMLWRVIDARAASQSKISARENVSLFEEVSRLAEGFQPASGQKIGVGLNLLRDRIASGRFKVSEHCRNTIFAYETYCGADGQKGACKDMIDCDRYGVLSGITDARPSDGMPTDERFDEVRRTGEWGEAGLFGGESVVRAGGY